jgi:hypothetical protein
MGSAFEWIFGGTNQEATDAALKELFTMEDFGFGLLEQALGEREKAMIAAYRAMVDIERGRNAALGFVPEDEPPPPGGGGGGGAAKKDPYEALRAKLEEQLWRLDEELRQSEIKYEFNQVELEAAREKAALGAAGVWLDFEGQAQKQELLGKMQELNPEFTEQIRLAKEMVTLHFAAKDEMREQLEKITEGVQLTQDEIKVRKALGLEVDESRGKQEALTNYIQLMVEEGRTAADQFAAMGENARLIAEQLESERLARQQHFAQEKLQWQMDELGYKAGLGMAYEPDQNRQAALQANYALDQLDMLLGQVATTKPSSQQAQALMKDLQDLHIEFVGLSTQMQEFGTSSGLNKIDELRIDIERKMADAADALDVDAMFNAPATALELVADAGLGASSALDVLTVAANNAAGAISSIIANARANAVAAGSQITNTAAGIAAQQTAAGGNYDLVGGGYAALGGATYSSGGGSWEYLWQELCSGGG